MSKTNTLLLYVSDVSASCIFYQKMLEIRPVEQSAGFALFILPSGYALALWNKHEVKPVPTNAAGGCELGFKLDNNEQVDHYYQEWKRKGAQIVLEPSDADFGRSFMALDPDGHRLRFYTLGENQ
ncbi:VOC family protein [Brucellaceae bacterium C25G]